MGTIKFEQVRFKSRKRCKCVSCGKAMSRSNVFVKNITATKTRQEAYADCTKEALTWHAKPERCSKCSA